MKRAIITGASGFVGSALLKKLLAEGYSVWAVVRTPKKLTGMECESLKVIKADKSEYGSLDQLIPDRGFDVLFHLAWEGVSSESYKDYSQQLDNAARAADLLGASVRLGVRRFVLISSIVSLEAKHYMLVNGGSPRMANVYGAAKAAAEVICKTLAYQQGIAFNVAVLASAYGKGDRSHMVQNVLIRALRRGECPKLVSGENLYDWVYVDDVASALITIAEKGAPNKTYYVGHRELQTFASLVSRTRDIVAPGVELIFGTMEDKTVMDWSMVDRTALYNDTGFICRADFDESIQRTAKWLLEEDNRMDNESGKNRKTTGGGIR